MSTKRSTRRNKEALKDEEVIIPEETTKIINKKNDSDDSSSDSSVENYLTRAHEIDLNSSFFTNMEIIKKPIPQKRLSNVDRLSESEDSDSDNEMLSNKVQRNVKKEAKIETETLNFQELNYFNKKLEDTKFAVQNYKNSLLKQENNMDVSDLLSAGESKVTELKFDIKDYLSDESSENEMDWEEVEDNKIVQAATKIPKEGVQITVELPTLIRKKKNDDYMSVLKRRLNRIKKENQVYMHQVHLLCWIAHGNYVNSVLNSENLLGLCLSLLPSEHCYPPKHADLNYLEQITRWYGKVIKLVEKNINKIPTISLEKILQGQLNKKEVNSKRNLVFLFICILRALGLQCRLVFSLRCVPLRPPNSELCSLATKTDEKKNEKKDQNTKESKSGVKNVDKPSTSKIETKMETNLKKINVPEKLNDKKLSPNKTDLKSKGKNKMEEKTKEIITKSTKNENMSEKKITTNKTETKTIKKNIDEKAKGNKSNLSEASTSKCTTRSKITKNPVVDKEILPHTSKKPNINKLKQSPKNPIKSFKNDSEEEFQSDKRNSSSEKLTNKRRTPSKSPKSSDVRNDIINLLKGDMINRKNTEKQKLAINYRKKTIENDSDDSDYAPEPEKKPKTKRRSNSEDEFKAKKATKVKQRVKPKGQIDSRVLSTDSDGEKKEKIGNDFWAEVFLEAEEKWISVDVVKNQVHCIAELHSRATSPVSYILAWNNNLSIKDITSRYSPHWNTVTRKLRIEPSWWNATLKPYVGVKNARDREEDEDLARQQLDQPLPKTIGEYKHHPLYALKRHLLKFEALYPPDALTLGFVRGEAVYARECIHTLHSREIWLKHAKVVKLGEQPYKIVKARPKYDKSSGTMITDQPLEIFGKWQVDDYIPPTAVNGVVPRNAYGNVELYKECMLPKGTVHLQLPGLNKVARRLTIDCAPALVGFEFHTGGTHPTYDGYIVCEEFKETLIAAWEEEQEEIERRELEKVEKRVYGNWRKLIRGLLIRERLKIKYEFEGTSGSGKGKKKAKGPRFCAKRRRVVSGSESNSN